MNESESLRRAEEAIRFAQEQRKRAEELQKQRDKSGTGASKLPDKLLPQN